MVGYPVLITHGSRGATKLQGPNVGCIGTQGALPKRVLEFLSFENFIRGASGGLSTGNVSRHLRPPRQRSTFRSPPSHYSQLTPERFPPYYGQSRRNPATSHTQTEENAADLAIVGHLSPQLLRIRRCPPSQCISDMQQSCTARICYRAEPTTRIPIPLCGSSRASGPDAKRPEIRTHIFLQNF